MIVIFCEILFIFIQSPSLMYNFIIIRHLFLFQYYNGRLNGRGLRVYVGGALLI
jgi:hypothetical protein